MDKRTYDRKTALMMAAGVASVSPEQLKQKPAPQQQQPKPQPKRYTQLRVGRNAPCPCGSGKKFKKCCLNGGQKRRNPPQPRSIATAVEFAPVAEAQFEDDAAASAMERAGVHPAAIHAFRVTKHFITPETRNAYDEATLEEWDQAIQEWIDDNGQEDLESDEIVAPRSEDADEG